MKLLIAALMLSVTMSGQTVTDTEMIREQFDACGAYELEDALPGETREIMDDLGIEIIPDAQDNIEPGKSLELIGNMAVKSAKKPLAACASALGIVVLCALAKNISEKNENSLSGSFDTVSSCAAVLTVCVPAAAFIDDVAAGISNSCKFASVAVPVLSGLTAVSGQAATAAAYSSFTLSVIEGITVLTSAVIVPGLRILFGISAVGALSSSFDLSKLICSVEKNCKWILGFIAMLLSGVLGISTVAAAAADNAATRAGRFLISGTVPVVGGVISEAIGTVINCIGIVRRSAGAFGIAAGVIIVLPAVITAAVWVLLLNCTAWAAEALDADRPASALRSISSVISFALGLTVFTAMVIICSSAIIISIRNG